MNSDPSTWFDHNFWGPEGVNISRWGPELARGLRYKDLGITTDGQPAAVRKISTGRKTYRGMASDSKNIR